MKVAPRRAWLLAACIVLGLVMISATAYIARFNLDNIDGISYISIARQYSHGLVDSAINAYWSPMLSWLVAPLISVGLAGPAALTAVNALASAAGLLLGTWVVWRRTDRNFPASILFATLTSIFYAANLATATPDILVVTWMILFVDVLIEVNDRFDVSSRGQLIVWGVVLGVVCGLGYFVKLFLVPVFIVAVLAWITARLVVARRQHSSRWWTSFWKRVLLLVLPAAMVTIIVAAPWVAALSVKYNEFTIGTSFTVNIEKKFEPGIVSPVSEPMTLAAPPNDHAVSFGEDRTQQIVARESRPDASVSERLWYYATQRVEALPYYLSKITAMAPFAIPLMLGLAVLFMSRYFRYRDIRAPIVVTSVWWIYFLGYAAITTAASGGGNSRYYWPLFVLSNLTLCLLLPAAIARARLAKLSWQEAAISTVAVVILLTAVWQHGLGRPTPHLVAPPPSGIYQVWTTSGKPRQQEIVERHLSRVIPPGSRLVGSNYRQVLKYAFYLEAQAYGRSGQGNDPADPKFQALMRQSGVDFYIQFTPTTQVSKELPNLGSIVTEFTTTSTCSDEKNAVIEACRIRVIQLAG